MIKPCDNVVATLSQPSDKVEASLCQGCEGRVLWQPCDNVHTTLPPPYNNLATVSKLYKVVPRSRFV